MSKLQEYLDEKPALTRAVVGFMRRGNEVLLGERKRVSDGLGELLLAGIGGKVEPGETDEEALKREWLEEVSAEVIRCRKVAVDTYLFPHKPKWNQLVTVYVIEALDGEPVETPDIRPIWVPETNLPTDRMWPDNVITIPLILAGEHFTGAFLYGPDGNVVEYTLEKQLPADI